MEANNINYKLAPNDNLRICPFDVHHEVLLSKLEKHLVACARNHPDVEIGRCRFNSTHIYRKQDVQEHERKCPDMGYVVQSLTHSEGSAEPSSFRQSVPDPNAGWQQNDEEENWDDDPPAQTYCPQKAKEGQFLFAIKTGAAPAERKKFQKQQNDRYSKEHSIEPRDAVPGLQSPPRQVRENAGQLKQKSAPSGAAVSHQETQQGSQPRWNTERVSQPRQEREQLSQPNQRSPPQEYDDDFPPLGGFQPVGRSRRK